MKISGYQGRLHNEENSTQSQTKKCMSERGGVESKESAKSGNGCQPLVGWEGRRHGRHLRRPATVRVQADGVGCHRRYARARRSWCAARHRYFPDKPRLVEKRTVREQMRVGTKQRTYGYPASVTTFLLHSLDKFPHFNHTILPPKKRE
jgi:hypothetical protein